MQSEKKTELAVESLRNIFFTIQTSNEEKQTRYRS